MYEIISSECSLYVLFLRELTLDHFILFYCCYLIRVICRLVEKIIVFVMSTVKIEKKREIVHVMFISIKKELNDCEN